jgi:DNA topoisomerase-1
LTKRILVICEKPTAAKRIAQALDDEGEPQGFIDRGVPYYIARKGRNYLLLVSALGHLFSIAQRGEEGWIYPIYDYYWAPSYVAEKGKRKAKRFIEIIESFSEGVDGYVNACDYDMEGSLIAYMILLNICGKESLDKAKRMRYSTLTDRELNKGWEEQSDQLDFPLIYAGRSRHEIDWLFGINLSRALTLSLKNTTGLYKTLSIGRVQGPTLNFIKEKEVKIRTFVPTPFWVIKAETRIKRKKFSLEYERQRLETQIEAEAVVERCNGMKGTIASLKTEIIKQPPFTPFSLGDLQREAYYKFRYSPRTTLSAA